MRIDSHTDPQMSGQRHHHRRRRSPDRRGYIYLAVLFTSLVVVSTVAAALSISTASVRSANDRSHRAGALRLAESELHRLAAGMTTSAQWRTDATNNALSDWYSITVDGSSLSHSPTLRYRLTDLDGLLDDDDYDPVEVTIEARIGRAQTAIVATLEPDPIPFDFLAFGITATDDIQIEGGSLTSENSVQVNDDCKTNSSGVLTAPTLHVGDAVEFTVRGDIRPASVNAPSRSVLDSYIDRGTEINTVGIPQDGSSIFVEDIVLSATSNPYGSVDPHGIYWMDADGKDVEISYCRIDATLAIRNADRIYISGGILWRYPTNPDAILISNSEIRFLDVEMVLDEDDRGVNFNPPTSPYLGTNSNLNTDDVYGTELRGLIYTSANVRVNEMIDDETLRLVGAIYCRDLRVDGHLTVSQLDELQENPPRGLSDPTPMRFVRGSWRQIPSP